MKSISEMLEKAYVKVIVGLVLFLLSWITADVRGVVNNIRVIYSIKDIDQYIAVIDFAIKLCIGLLLLVIYVSSLLIIKSKHHSVMKIMSDKDVMQFIDKSKINIKSIIIWGYSCSFAKDIWDYISKTDSKDVEVTIIAPSDRYILENILDFYSTNSRLDILNGRIHDWLNLQSEHRVKSTTIYRTNTLPYAYGYIINDELALVGHYIWKYENGKYIYDRMPYNKRKLTLINKKNDSELFEYFIDKVNMCMKLAD